MEGCEKPSVAVTTAIWSTRYILPDNEGESMSSLYSSWSWCLGTTEPSSGGSLLFSKGKRSFSYEVCMSKYNALVSMTVRSCSEAIYKPAKKTAGARLDFTDSRRKEAALEMSISLGGMQRMNWFTWLGKPKVLASDETSKDV